MRVIRYSSDIGWWESTFRDPHPALRCYVVGPYQGWVEHTLQPVRRREVPSAIVPVILNLGSPFVMVDREPGGKLVQINSFAAGLHTTYALVEGAGTSRCIQLNLTPIGALLVFGRPLSDLTNLTVTLDDLFGQDSVCLVDRLHDAAGWEECFALVDAFLATRIARARPPAPVVAWAWRLLEQSGGCQTIAEMSAEIGCSRKHLTVQMREQLGLPPKMLGRVIRFDRAIRAAKSVSVASWVVVAQDCGYFDQAHFIRDFVAFSGMTPGEYQRRRIPDGGLLN